MRAVVYTEYGPPDVLRLEEVAKPVPKENEILVRVYATPVNYGDTTGRNFPAITPSKFNMPLPLWFFARIDFGLSKPKRPILGSEFAGEVAAVGKDVTRFNVGDRVYGYSGQSMGANAEYLAIAENRGVALKPANLSYEEAAAVPYGAITALNLLRKVDIQPGQKVLINGASGSIGAAAVQLASHYFGAEVTGVCSTRRIDYVKALGAAHVVDYTQEDFTRNGETYDLIFDILGRSSFARCKNSLTHNGRYLLASFKTKQLAQMLWTSFASSQKVICALSIESPDDLELITELVEAGKVKTIIDRCYPAEQAADAHRYYESGDAAGKVVITFAAN
ncbi:MAG: NAD(P)-dependent alcohol dehydrogenase [Anaerolineae bacterium]|nr:NAD(P)-dependent alcohol dehydrogenase [Anaerolineae bacterium]